MTEHPSPESRGTHPIGFLTPYELAFSEAGLDSAHFTAVQEEAERTGVDPLRLDDFVLLERTAELVEQVVPADAPPVALTQYRALLYHAFNFWRFGRRTYGLDAATARFLVESKPSIEGWSLTLPYPEVYVQLPRHLFWSGIDAEATPEPVDGFFVSAVRETAAAGPPFWRVNMVLVLGVRPDRAGFSVIPFDMAVGPEIAGAWTDDPGREEGRDFDNILPGGEIGRLYSLLTVGEVMRLFAWTMWYIDQHPDAVEEGWRPDIDEGGPMRASRLAFSRIGLEDS